MARMICVVLFFVWAIIFCNAIPTNEKKHRSHEKSLSDLDHELHGEHNREYDHDAFLGHDEAQTFDQLSPEESKKRLGKIVDKIDKNGDGEVTEEELKEWIQYVQRRYIVTDTERMWKDHEPESDDTLTWKAYQKRTFGYTDEPKEGSPTFEYKDMIERDYRRWKHADKNEDGKLSKQEFQDFLHPEEAEHMRGVVVDETLEDIDKDGDGKISIKEYIDDIWGDEDDDDDDEESEAGEKEGEPDWVRTEREQFANFRDKNHDGYLDKEEIREWIIPEDYDHSSAEAQHLMRSSDEDGVGDMWPRSEEEEKQEEPEWIKNEREQFSSFRDRNKDGHLDRDEVLDWILPVSYDHYEAESKHLVQGADADKNGALTKEEIVEKYDLFVGSQATDFGEALTKHDEF
ncbi:calumenin [Elysia marginata]|uniref:Reticulocalbin-3 n=1 Tax=Elysia marginata TaxID=1093978 RepID=A0AAV4H493_9GAST|nr:calumenin [Elysia marginata]